MKPKSKKPVIGVTLGYGQPGQAVAGVDHNLIRREYGEQLRLAGATPIFLDANIDPEVAADLCDGILISGGEDIDPIFYGSDVKPTHATEPTVRTMWEKKLIKACDQRGKHILGICYGAQLLNVHYGGTLYRDIQDEKTNAINHGRSDKASLHLARFAADFLSFHVEDEVMIACRHHQAVRDIAPGFVATVFSPDGVIEAIEGHGHYGVQWHAEADGTAADIYQSFVKKVSESSKPVVPDIAPVRFAEPV